MKTDLYVLSCSLLLLTAPIFCADPYIGEGDPIDLAMGHNQQTNPVTVLSPDEFKWLAHVRCGHHPQRPPTPEKSEQWLGLTEQEYIVLAATARPPKQSKITSPHFAVPHAEFVSAPGIQRFYSLIEPAQQKAILISGKDRQSVDAAFRQLIESRFSDQVNTDDVPSVIERVQKEENVLCAIKEIERLCDVLVPVELEQYVTDIPACAHENSVVCSQHKNKVCEALAQAAEQSEATHEAMVGVPHICELITYAAE